MQFDLSFRPLFQSTKNSYVLASPKIDISVYVQHLTWNYHKYSVWNMVYGIICYVAAHYWWNGKWMLALYYSFLHIEWKTKLTLRAMSTRPCSTGWWRGTLVERRSLAGELSLSCARPAADGWPLMWVSHPLQVSQLGQLSLSSFRGR